MYPVCTGSAALQRRVIRLRSDGFFVAGRVVFLFVNRYPKEYVALDHKKAGKRRASHRLESSYVTSATALEEPRLWPCGPSWWVQALYATVPALRFRQPRYPLLVAHRTDCLREQSRSE